ncbi:Predicted membrane protein [Ekhidna lutea]|uniref:Predicted membrane protein n=1 Tax=Ekhidna lutea TaxID=447679 RepID=A0A239IEQ7_EKHLU|nr:DUF2306 domain-containing protein [Ekhidna lutea]SNS92019.1 Predicted membrane protein [Ekhidna lutea]
MKTKTSIKLRNGFYGFLCIGVALYALSHLFRVDFYSFKMNGISTSSIWRTAFHFHFIGGAVALAIGWTQFLKNFRSTHLKTHRRLGYVYITAILLISSPAAFYMALYANGGFNNVVGFGMMALCWFGFTAMAFVKIKNKDLDAHERWMIRSFAVTLGAVTLRVFMPIMIISGVSPEEAYQVIAWFCWVPNLFVAEYLISKKYLAAAS